MAILDTFSLAGKTALLTGGAGLYGRQILRGLAEAGARTYIASRNLDALEALAAEHRGAGHDVRPLRLDQADEASIAAVRERIVAESGGLHVLVNNAVARPTRGLSDDAAKIDESLHVNGTGLILVTRGLADAIAD
ncbi:MAG: SDR family NAD(P)-dependent oxidoreductase, partial [Planctomycetia bacterium]